MLKQYRKAHVLLYALWMTLMLGFSKKSLELVRLAVQNKIMKRLRRQYRSFIQSYCAAENHGLERRRSNKVWVLWLQGMEQAPPLVQRCYASLQEHLGERKIILLTEDNYREYAKFPDFIQQKIDSGVITRTHMSDLLRLELLIRYGGTWMDATVFCSGGEYPAAFFDSDLFLFQCLKPGLDGHPLRISSWFITACTNHPILLLSRALLYDYWAKHNDLIEYFLVHDCLELAIETYPEEWKRVSPYCNSTPHILLLRMFEQYQEEIWNDIRTQIAFHKLSYKLENAAARTEDSYCDRILGKVFD